MQGLEYGVESAVSDVRLQIRHPAVVSIEPGRDWMEHCCPESYSKAGAGAASQAEKEVMAADRVSSVMYALQIAMSCRCQLLCPAVMKL